MDEVEQVSVFQKSYLETYLERESRKDKYRYVYRSRTWPPGHCRIDNVYIKRFQLH